MMKKINDLVKVRNVLICINNANGLDTLISGLFEWCPDVVVYASANCYAAIKELTPRDKVWNNLLSFGQLTRDMETEGTSFEALHPQVFLGLAGQLYSGQHQKLVKDRHIPSIDVAIVNLQPLAVPSRQNDFKVIMDCVDFPGQALLSAACSNPYKVAVLSEPQQYEALLEEVEEFKGQTSLGFRLEMAKESSLYLQNYSAGVSSFLNDAVTSDVEACFEVLDPANDFLEKISQETSEKV